MRPLTLLLVAALSLSPIAAGAQAVTPASSATVAVPMLDRAIGKGDLLSAADFVTQDMPVAQARTMPRLKDMVGMEAVRPLVAGTVVRSSDLIRPQLVRRGEPVKITFRDGGLLITTTGRALNSGASGDVVRIVSLSTNRTLDGFVESTGTVRVAAH